MVERGQQLGFALEARQALRVLGERRRQRFDRHLAAEARVVRAVHLAHAARSERCDDLVGADAGALRQWHRPNLPQTRGLGCRAPIQPRAARPGATRSPFVVSRALPP